MLQTGWSISVKCTEFESGCGILLNTIPTLTWKCWGKSQKFGQDKWCLDRYCKQEIHEREKFFTFSSKILGDDGDGGGGCGVEVVVVVVLVV